MEKYINANNFKARVREQQNECSKPENIAAFIIFSLFLQAIDEEPAADVQPINSLVKVEERVPDVSGNYLCYLADGKFEVLYFDREIEDDEYNIDYPFGVWNTYPSEDGGECREWIEVLEVTHWQPLPEPPKDGDANGEKN